MQCRECGYDNAPENKFCQECGTPLSEVGQDPPSLFSENTESSPAAEPPVSPPDQPQGTPVKSPGGAQPYQPGQGAIPPYQPPVYSAPQETSPPSYSPPVHGESQKKSGSKGIVIIFVVAGAVLLGGIFWIVTQLMGGGSKTNKNEEDPALASVSEFEEEENLRNDPATLREMDQKTWEVVSVYHQAFLDLEQLEENQGNYTTGELQDELNAIGNRMTKSSNWLDDYMFSDTGYEFYSYTSQVSDYCTSIYAIQRTMKFHLEFELELPPITEFERKEIANHFKLISEGRLELLDGVESDLNLRKLKDEMDPMSLAYYDPNKEYAQGESYSEDTEETDGWETTPFNEESLEMTEAGLIGLTNVAVSVMLHSEVPDAMPLDEIITNLQEVEDLLVTLNAFNSGGETPEEQAVDQANTELIQTVVSLSREVRQDLSAGKVITFEMLEEEYLDEVDVALETVVSTRIALYTSQGMDYFEATTRVESELDQLLDELLGDILE